MHECVAFDPHLPRITIVISSIRLVMCYAPLLLLAITGMSAACLHSKSLCTIFLLERLSTASVGVFLTVSFSD